MKKPRKEKRGVGARYRWRPEYRGKRCVRADDVVRELQSVAASDGGNPRPQAVVDRARPDHAKLHPLFTWDDRVAAERYRCEEARDVITGTQPIIVALDGEPTATAPSTYVHVGGDDAQEPRYLLVAEVMESPDLRKQAILGVLAQMRALAKKHTELASLLGTLEQIEQEIRVA